MNRAFYWAPRVLSLLFIAFLSVFALDVFEEYEGWALAVALFMHLLPSLVLLGVVAIAWKYELVGAIAFLIGALLYIWWTWWARRDDLWIGYTVICGPAIIVAILFFLNWRHKNKPHTTQ